MRDIYIKHPVFQFFAVGLVIFVLNYFFTKENRQTKNVVITDEVIEEAVSSYKITYRENPDSTLLRSILEAEIDKEVLYHKALSLGLDKNNDAVKAELAQAAKQYLMSEADLTDPGDPVLQEFLNEKRDEFHRPDLYGFDQYYFGDNEQLAKEALKMVEEGIQVKGVDDPDFPNHFKEMSPIEIARRFGPEFKEDIVSLTTGQFKAAKSLWGWHLVKLTRFDNGKELNLEENRDTVLMAWREQVQRQYYEKVLSNLKKDVEYDFRTDSLRRLIRK